MKTMRFRSPMPCSQQELWEFHGSSEALNKLNPPLVTVKLEGETKVQNGAKLSVVTYLIRIPVGSWQVELFEVDPPNGFKDRSLKSPFLFWTHHHLFEANGAQSVLTDEVSFEAPHGPIGRLLGTVFVFCLFKFRHWKTRRLLKR